MKPRTTCGIGMIIWLACSVSVTAAPAGRVTGGDVIDAKVYHLGSGAVTNWPEAVSVPDGKLEARFGARGNEGEMVLAITQRDINSRCALHLNGKQIAVLKRNRGARTFLYLIPPGTLTNGQNVLSFLPANATNDLVIGPVRLHRKTLRELLQLHPLTVTVTDNSTEKPLPARLTITDLSNRRVELFYADPERTAVREGVLYTLGTETRLELPAGDYAIYATRGMEWSRDQQTFSLHKDRAARLQLRLQREVDTTGFVAADTHIHTLTFSGHGDSSVEERMVTLAGEGVELAVSTDHNHNTDYQPYQAKMCVTDYFTAVTGNEVTTPVGHINAFPLRPDDPVPDYKLKDWVQLVDGIRAKGAKVVILNHPRWPSIPKSVMTQFGLNRVSGDFTNGTRFPFDAMELANALTPQPDPLYLFRDWFALLNHGERITAVGSSDSHTVDDPVGQGRSYLPSRTDAPPDIDVADVCRRFVAGENSIALGIFADVLVDGRFRMGSTNSMKDKTVKTRLRIASPGWVRPRRALVFFNGQQVAEKKVPTRPDRPTDVWLELSAPRPVYDAYLVCVVIGDGVTHPSWKTREKFTLAATNPIYLDCDGDGQYRSPRENARLRLAAAGESLEQQWGSVAGADDVIAAQMVSLMSQNSSVSYLTELEQRVRKAAVQRPMFGELLDPGAQVIKLRAAN